MSRSKQFDVDEVLLRAVQLFWDQGYENTSMQDLVEAMGIHKRSLYDTFGDKHTLFMKVLDRYEGMSDSRMDRMDSEPVPGSAKEQIRAVFEQGGIPEAGRPRGCLMVNTAVELALHDPEAAAKVNDYFAGTEMQFYRMILSGQQTGEFSSSLDAARMAEYLSSSLAGLRVLVKTTGDMEKLGNIIEMTLAVLD